MFLQVFILLLGLQEIDGAEVCAGWGILARVLRSQGHQIWAMDIDYWEAHGIKSRCNNPLDLLQPSGMAHHDCTGGSKVCWIVYRALLNHVRLLIVAAMRARPGSVFHFGLVCSSWVVISRFSSGRHKLCPMGNTSLQWVEDANTMVSRLRVCNYDSFFG